jgi:hypothetical protein
MKKFYMIAMVILTFIVIGSQNVIAQVVPGNGCDNAARISPSYNYISKTLPGGNAIHSYKVAVPKGWVLAVDLVNTNYNAQQMGVTIRKNGWYAGTRWDCEIMVQSDCSPAPKETKRLIFIPEISGDYIIFVQGINGGQGPYKLRVLTAPFNMSAN